MATLLAFFRYFFDYLWLCLTKVKEAKNIFFNNGFAKNASV